jgi:hypothetical protein
LFSGVLSFSLLAGGGGSTFGLGFVRIGFTMFSNAYMKNKTNMWLTMPYIQTGPPLYAVFPVDNARLAGNSGDTQDDDCAASIYILTYFLILFPAKVPGQK